MVKGVVCKTLGRPGRRERGGGGVTGMDVGCLFFVQHFVWHSFAPVFLSVIPLQMEEISGGER